MAYDAENPYADGTPQKLKTLEPKSQKQKLPRN